jgi:hypothetical protein
MIVFLSKCIVLFLVVGSPLILGYLTIQAAKRKKAKSEKLKNPPIQMVQSFTANWMIFIGILLFFMAFLGMVMLLN